MKLVNDILFESFYENQSVNFIVKQDAKKEQRLVFLLDYAIYMGNQFGKVYLNKSSTACAVVVDTAKKKVTPKVVLWNIKLVFKVIGVKGVLKALQREKVLKQYQPKTDYIYLWFIGVKNEAQGKGLGTQLLKEIVEDYKGKAIHLETSTIANLSFYEQNGFKRVSTLNEEIGYPLFIYTYQQDR